MSRYIVEDLVENREIITGQKGWELIENTLDSEGNPRYSLLRTESVDYPDFEPDYQVVLNASDIAGLELGAKELFVAPQGYFVDPTKVFVSYKHGDIPYILNNAVFRLGLGVDGNNKAQVSTIPSLRLMGHSFDPSQLDSNFVVTDLGGGFQYCYQPNALTIDVENLAPTGGNGQIIIKIWCNAYRCS